MSDLLLNIQAGTLPTDCYPPSADDFQKQILALARAVFPGTTAGVAIGDSPPSDHDMVWARTDASGNLIRFYTWGGYGVWVSPHLDLPSTNIRKIWVGAEADLITFDEGTSDPVTPTTGPFWTVDHAFDFRTPVGPGTFPSGTALAVNGTMGEETHALTDQEMPPHRHNLVNTDFSTSPEGQHDTGILGGTYIKASNSNPSSGFSYDLNGSGTEPSQGLSAIAGGDADEHVVAHNNIQPSIGAFFIKRTARIYYTV